MNHDPVNHPKHYTSHPSGIECIQVTEHMGFCIGNAIKYLWRAGEKGDALEDLKKARWYVDREIQKREREVSSHMSRESEKVGEPVYLRTNGWCIRCGRMGCDGGTGCASPQVLFMGQNGNGA